MYSIAINLFFVFIKLLLPQMDPWFTLYSII